MVAFVTLPSGAKPDSSKFSEEIEDVAMRTELEGGYVATRPKHTRSPRKMWPVGYTNITDADKTALDDFYRLTAKGGSVIFDWTNPANSTVYQVRFKSSLQFQYKGVGNLRLWDCSFQLEQA